MPKLEKLFLHKQAATRLPPILGPIRELWLFGNRSLVSLEGIERLVTLESLALTDMPGLDLDDEFKRLAKLPKLSTLKLIELKARALPAAIAKLPALIELELVRCPQLELGGALKSVGKIATLRSLKLEKAGTRALADVLAPLVPDREAGPRRVRGRDAAALDREDGGSSRSRCWTAASSARCPLSSQRYRSSPRSMPDATRSPRCPTRCATAQRSRTSSSITRGSRRCRIRSVSSRRCAGSVSKRQSCARCPSRSATSRTFASSFCHPRTCPCPRVSIAWSSRSSTAPRT